MSILKTIIDIMIARKWTLQLDTCDEHCLRLLHPRGSMLRCWHGQQAYALLGYFNSRRLLPISQLLGGKSIALKQPEVRELLLMAARTSLEIECFSQFENALSN